MAEIKFKAKQTITEVDGKPIEELSKEELIAFLNTLLNHYESKIKELLGANSGNIYQGSQSGKIGKA